MALTEKLTAVADAIRSKTGKTDTLTLDRMATEIAGIETGGGDDIFKQLVQGVAATVLSSDKVERLRAYMFYEDLNIQEVYLPNCTFIGSSIFRGCKNLKKVLFNASLANACFVDCTALEALILPSKTLLPFERNNTFVRSGVANGTGYIYVPSVLLEEYKTATNWSVYADQFRAIEGSEYE